MVQTDETLAYPFPPAATLYEPAPTYERLRDECPVARVQTPDGKSAYLVTRYADVRQVLTDARFSRARAAGPAVPLSGLGRLASGSMLGMDPPEHSRLRRLVARAFTARRVEELRPRVTGLVDELLGSVRDLGQPADLVEHFTIPLPVHVICELIGVPVRDRHVLHAWSDTVMGDWLQHPAELDRVVDSLLAYFAELVAAKRARPADDLMTALITARDEHDHLTEDELVGTCLGLLIAGHETSVAQIGMSIVTLLHHPDQLDRLRAQPDLVPQAVEELLRFVQISAGGGTLPRVTTEEVQLGDVCLPPGAVVMQATPSANRDPRRFADPDRLDLSRVDNAHLTFGTGIHFCLGAALARMELQEAVRGLLRHLPGLRPVVPDHELRFKQGMFLRSLESLPVCW